MKKLDVWGVEITNSSCSELMVSEAERSRGKGRVEGCIRKFAASLTHTLAKHLAGFRFDCSTGTVRYRMIQSRARDGIDRDESRSQKE